MGITVRSDRVGGKKGKASPRRIDTPRVSPMLTSRQINASRTHSNAYSLMKSGKSSKKSPNVLSIYDSQLSESYDTSIAAKSPEAASNNFPSEKAVPPPAQNVVSSSSAPHYIGPQQSQTESYPYPQNPTRTHLQATGPSSHHTEPKSLKGPLSLQNRIQAGRTRQKYNGEDEISDMKYLVEEGPLSFRAISLIAGFFMILASALDLIDEDEGDRSAMGELITVFLWIFGIIIITLEGRPFHIQIPYLYDFIVTYFGCFRYVWGRGFFYFTGGCLQFFLFTKYDMVSGVLFMLMGIVSIIAGYKASVKLAGLRNSISNRSDIRYLFHTFDKDRDGFLNIEEFRDMMAVMDQNVDYNEFVAALSAIDMDNNQQISVADMEKWFLEYSEDELPPGMNCCGSTRYDTRPRPNNDNYSHSPNAHMLA